MNGCSLRAALCLVDLPLGGLFSTTAPVPQTVTCIDKCTYNNLALPEGGGRACGIDAQIFRVLEVKEMTEEILRELREALSRQSAEDVIRLIKDLHPADIADNLEFLNTEELRSFSMMVDDDLLVDIMEELDDFAQADLAAVLKRQRLAINLGRMAPDEAADLLLSVNEDVATELLNAMRDKEAHSLRELMKYPPDSAGGLMTSEYMSLESHLTVGEALVEVRKGSRSRADVETVYYIYVCDDQDHLIGILSLRDLLASDDHLIVRDIMDSDVIAVSVEDDQEYVAQTLERYGFIAIPVVEKGKLVGIITFDDVISTIEEEATEDLFRQSGIGRVADSEMMRSERIIQAPILQILSLRLPWLLVVLVGGLLAGGVIGRYEEVLQSIVVLAFFIPVIMDMGGNVGTQASTIFVRGIVLGHIEPDRVWYYILREVGTGFSIGILTGLAAGAAATIWQGDIAVGLVVFLSMTITCTVASLIGFGVPWIVYRTGADPAAASAPFITTIKDISGLAIYFTLAALLLGHLM